MIQPEWHGWMHHMYDEVPGETPKHPRPFIPNHTASSAIYRTHVYEPKGGVEPVKQVNQSQLRQRGWQVGSLQTKGGEPDRYWLHSGHPLNPRAYGDDGSKPLRYATQPKKKEALEGHLAPENFNPAKKPAPLKMEDIKFDTRPPPPPACC